MGLADPPDGNIVDVLVGPRTGRIRVVHRRSRLVGSAAFVGVDDVNADAFTADATHDLTKRLCCTSVAPDYSTEILGVHADL
jgi:hypothetical protein